jgi:hypothetical protein
VASGALVAGAAVASGALVAGAAVAGALPLTAAVGSAGVGAAAGSGLPPHAARIGRAITSSNVAALIRIWANAIFTINLLIKRTMSICSTCFIVHEIARMLKCARTEAKLIASLSRSDDVCHRSSVSCLAMISKMTR